MHIDIWQNQYNIVKLKNKIKKKRKKNWPKKKTKTDALHRLDLLKAFLPG